MSDLLARFSAGQLKSGVFPDLTGQDSPLWDTAANVRFSSDGISPFPGQYLLFSKQSAQPITGLRQVLLADEPAVVIGNPTSLFLWTESAGLSNVTNTTPYTGSYSVPNLWSIERWGSWAAATNGKDPPQLFKHGSSSTFEDNAPGEMFSTCQIYVRWRNFMLALNTDVDDAMIAWCNRDDIEDWVPGTTKSSNYIIARDMDSEIRAGLEFNGGPVFFSKNSMHQINYIQPPYYFGSVKLLDGIGAVSKNAVCTQGNLLYGWGPRGIWTCDGVNYRYLAQGIVRNYIFDNLNEQRLGTICCYNDTFTGHVIFFFPGDGSDYPNRAIAYNYADANWTIPAFARTAASQAGVFNAAITGDWEGNVFAQSVTGAPVPAGADSGRLAVSSEYELQIPWNNSGWNQGGWGGRYSNGG